MTAAPITFFEITGAAMFLAFSRHPADAVVLEVGLGGKYDATNVVATARHDHHPAGGHWITRNFWATTSPASRRKRPASSSRACRW